MRNNYLLLFSPIKTDEKLYDNIHVKYILFNINNTVFIDLIIIYNNLIPALFYVLDNVGKQ